MGQNERYNSPPVRGYKTKRPLYPQNGIANSLVIGEKYVIHASVTGDLANMGERKKDIRMKCVGLYPHLAVFERPAGYCEAFTYWELERVIVE